MVARTGLHEMLAFCQEQKRCGKPIEAIVCWHTNRFSRAKATETDWYIWEFYKAGVRRMLTAERLIDFDRDEDMLLFRVQQDFSNNKQVRDTAQATIRGRIIKAQAGGLPGGPIPFGYRKGLNPDGKPWLVLAPRRRPR